MTSRPRSATASLASWRLSWSLRNCAVNCGGPGAVGGALEVLLRLGLAGGLGVGVEEAAQLLLERGVRELPLADLEGDGVGRGAGGPDDGQGEDQDQQGEWGRTQRLHKVAHTTQGASGGDSRPGGADRFALGRGDEVGEGGDEVARRARGGLQRQLELAQVGLVDRPLVDALEADGLGCGQGERADAGEVLGAAEAGALGDRDLPDARARRTRRGAGRPRAGPRPTRAPGRSGPPTRCGCRRPRPGW